LLVKKWLGNQLFFNALTAFFMVFLLSYYH
jgi:hypothetical protein